MHLLAKLTRVIKAIGSPVQKDKNIPHLHRLYNHGDAKHLHHISMEMLNSTGPCILPQGMPLWNVTFKNSPLHLTVQPVFPQLAVYPSSPYIPSLSTKILLQKTTVQLVLRWSKSPPRAQTTTRNETSSIPSSSASAYCWCSLVGPTSDPGPSSLSKHL